MSPGATSLLYLEDFTLMECDARVAGVLQENNKDIVVLDQTVFYPQGGGQPYDTGVIESPTGKFLVEEVRFVDPGRSNPDMSRDADSQKANRTSNGAGGIVRHIGKFEHGTFAAGESVHCRVDETRRLLHNRIHSAGHLIDMAISELEPAWTPDPRGYHYPNGPYVMYNGTLEGLDKEKLKTEIEELCRKAIQKGQKVDIWFMTKGEMQSICRSIPDQLPEPARVIMFGSGFGVPCGGTHVKNLSEIRGLTIRKIKQEGTNIRVGYDVAL